MITSNLARRLAGSVLLAATAAAVTVTVTATAMDTQTPAAPAAAAQEAQPQTPAQGPAEVSSIRNFLRINDQFCTGGQPRMEHLDLLKAEGVKAIINLRTPGEHRAEEEEAKAKAVGLRYFNIPVVFRDPKPEQIDEFLKLTDDPANRPAFIHCTAAVRVGAFWMARRVMRDGWTIEKAEEEAKQVGLRESPHLNEFVRKYVADHKK